MKNNGRVQISMVAYERVKANFGPKTKLLVKGSITQNIINAMTTNMGRNKGGMHKQKKIR